jgi:hypothetical protein
MTMIDRTGVDRELAAVLICLRPLGERGLSYVDSARREFDYLEMLADHPWSSGERQMIIAAGGLWNRAVDRLDLAYLATLSPPFFQAFVDAVAALRGQDFTSDWRLALANTVSERVS